MLHMVPTATGEVSLYAYSEIAQDILVDAKLPFQVVAQFAFHPVDLSRREHVLRDDTPRFVRIGVIADDPAREHERGYEESMARGAFRGGETRLEALQQEERSICNTLG